MLTILEKEEMVVEEAIQVRAGCNLQKFNLHKVIFY